MKKLLTLLILTSILSCNSQEKTYSDLKRDNLKGEIETLKETYYNVETITELYQDEDGYDDYKIIGYKKGDLKGTDEYIGFKNYYDKKGIISEYENFYNGKLSNKTKYRFNSLGQKIDLEHYDFKENKFKKSQKYYSEEYIYNNFEVINKSKITSTNEPYSITKTKYNEKGRIIKWSTEYLKTKSKNSQSFVYDINNYLIQMNNYLNGTKKNTIYYKNDKEGNKIEEKINENEKYLIRTFQYKYDNHKNWIEKTTISSNGTKETITEREIEYYKKD